MKNKILIIFLLMFCMLGIGACGEICASDYLRLHIRANSNAECDQTVKYLVREKIVEELSPIICKAKSKNELIEILSDNFSKIEEVIDNFLQEKGFNYKAKVTINNELFPTRYYGEYLFPSDYYDALIITLGSGCGDNWWCVVYPPLCFTENTDSLVYKSKLVEIIKQFFN